MQNEKEIIEAEKQTIKKKFESEIEKLNLLNKQKSDEYDSLKSELDVSLFFFFLIIYFLFNIYIYIY